MIIQDATRVDDGSVSMLKDTGEYVKLVVIWDIGSERFYNLSSVVKRTVSLDKMQQVPILKCRI